MKKLILYILPLFIGSLLLSCESDNEFGLDESQKALNFRMVPDLGSFNILAGDPEVNFTMYSENINIEQVTVLVELFQFATNSTTPKQVLTTIDGSAITNDGSTTMGVNLSEFATASGVALEDLSGGDIFTIYNIVELSNGLVYPDTVVLNGVPYVNIEGSFLAGTSSFTAQLNFPIVCPVSSPFVGTYAVTDDCGLFFGNVDVTSNGGAQRVFTGTWGGDAVGATFDGIGFAFDLTCGNIFVATQSIGLGCGGGSNVDVVTSANLGPGTYDDLDDAQFTINVFYSNGDCFGDFDCTLNFVKQ